MVNCAKPKLFVARQMYLPVFSSLTFVIVRQPFCSNLASRDRSPRDHSTTGRGVPVAAQHNSTFDPGLTETCEGAILVNTGGSSEGNKYFSFIIVHSRHVNIIKVQSKIDHNRHRNKL